MARVRKETQIDQSSTDVRAEAELDDGGNPRLEAHHKLDHGWWKRGDVQLRECSAPDAMYNGATALLPKQLYLPKKL